MQFGLTQMAQAYAYFWLFSFVSSLIMALSANGGYGIPLYQVVDVQLGSLFSVIVLFEALYVILLVIMLIARQFLVAMAFAVWMLAYAAVSFAPLMAFELYGWIGGIDFKEQSRTVADLYAIVHAVSDPVYAAIVNSATDDNFETIDRTWTIASIVLFLTGATRLVFSSARGASA